ncbi:MAG: ABC transporter ATP-binding protein [Bacteroidaceae bacterium]|nr:ABC transporter ATP-binding protein [Bacteroidaceae bacterium]
MKIKKTKYPIRQIALWLWKYHEGCRRQALINVCVGLLQVGAGLLWVDLLRRMTDVATGAASGNLLMMVGAFASVLAFELLLNIASAWIRAVLGVRTRNNIQKIFFARLLRCRWNGVDRFHTGDVLNRLFGDVRDIVGLMTELLPAAVVIVVQFVASFVYLYSMDSTIALILATVSPLFMLLSRIYFRRMRRIVRRIKDTDSALQSIIQECLQHKMVVKVFGLETAMTDRLAISQRLLCRQVKTRARLAVFSRTLINIGFSGGFFVALVWGLFRLQEHLITVGMLMAFVQLIGRIQRPILDMARLLPSFVNCLAASDRLMELEDLPSEAVGDISAVDGPAGISFRNVSFRYTEQGHDVLRNFTHDFAPSSFTAVLGKTGAGKTTLVRLMLALIEQSEGSVTLYSGGEGKSGIPVSPLTRCNFSYVPQGNTLFSGTIRENLLLGNPSASDEEIRRALHIAMADFVYDLPDGLDTRCGEQGGGLSEGQAQRVSIARAVIRPCRILLLDEATSALDMETECELLRRIKTNMSGMTVIFITHRQAVVDFASECLTLECAND